MYWLLYYILFSISMMFFVPIYKKLKKLYQKQKLIKKKVNNETKYEPIQSNNVYVTIPKVSQKRIDQKQVEKTEKELEQNLIINNLSDKKNSKKFDWDDVKDYIK